MDVTLLYFLLYFSFVLCGSFLALSIYVLFFPIEVSQKQETTQEYQKQFSSVCCIFSTITSIGCFINLETSNAKIHNTKVVGLLFIFVLDTWIAYFG
jgi:hypothetical protein